MTDKFKAHLGLLGANLIFGANFSIAKIVMPRLIHPLGFIFLRVSCATALFWLFAFAPRYRQPIARRDWLRLIACSLFGIAINQFLFFLGLARTFPIHASLMSLTTPLMITVLSALILGDPITWKKLLGLLLGISGAVFLLTWGQEILLNRSSALGDLLVFLNAVSYAGFLVLVKPLMNKYPAILVIRWVFTLGLIWVIPVGYGEFSRIPWSRFGMADWASAGFVVLGTTFAAYTFNAYGVKVLSPSRTGAYIYLQPVFAALIAMTFFSEHLGWIKICSALMIFAGVYLVERQAKGIPPRKSLSSPAREGGISNRKV